MISKTNGGIFLAVKCGICIALITLTAFIMCLSVGCKNLEARAYSEQSAEIVIEASTRRVLTGKNELVGLPIASTTKILTAYVIIRDCVLDEVVTVPAQAEGVEGSSAYLKKGEKYTVNDLLYALMLRSGNDCAVALALYHSSSLEQFSEAMNKAAAECGATNSNFVNPHGLHDANHYASAIDLALITATALENDDFAKIVSTKNIRITEIVSGSEKYLANKNKLLSDYDGACGVKTGYTKNSGKCLVSAAKREDMRLICVLLNCPTTYETTAELFNGCFTKYKLTPVAFPNEVYTCDYKYASATLQSSIDKTLLYPLADDELNYIRLEFVPCQKISLPVKKETISGKLQIYFQNQLIFSENTFSINSVKISYKKILIGVAQDFCRRSTSLSAS